MVNRWFKSSVGFDQERTCGRVLLQISTSIIENLWEGRRKKEKRSVHVAGGSGDEEGGGRRPRRGRQEEEDN